MQSELAPHVEEIKRALDNQIDDKSIAEELKTLLEYRVSLSEAKQSLIRKYAERSRFLKLKEIKIGDRNIEVKGKILELSRKNIHLKDGEKIVFTGVISDETAARSFTAWEDFKLNIGDVVQITNAYVKRWQNIPMINLSRKSKVTKLNMSIESHKSELKKLSELRDGDVNVHTCFVILSIQHENGTGVVSGVVADEDTKLPIISWVTLPELVEGNVIEVENTYVRLFRGVPTLNINENSTVRKIDKEICYKPERILIGKLIRRDGAFDVTVEGNIISVRPGSGLITRCSECLRVIQKGVCKVHGKVNEIMDMRIKAIMDDGTGALTLILGSELTQQVCGFTIDEAREMAKKAMSLKAVEDEIKKKLIGKIFRARGNMSKGEFGATLVANRIWVPSDEIKDRASRLLHND